MKNRPKSSLEACWALLGPLSCLIGILERLGSILGASWERLGASWGRPGGIPEPEGDPTWTPGSAQNRSKIDPKSHWFFDRFLDAILIPKWSEWLPKPSKSGTKKCFIFRSFFHRFLDRCWGPKSLKMSTACTREAHFHKIAFSDSEIFLEAKMMKKRFPKWNQNGLTNQSNNQRSFRSILDLVLKAFGSILGVQIPSKID